MDKDYYEGHNVNDYYGVRKEVLKLLNELEGDFDNRIKSLFGPKKVKSAATDVRRSCRKMIGILEEIKDKVQATRLDYKSDYSDK